VHPKVADRLLRTLRRAREPEVRSAILGALGHQKTSQEKVMKKVVTWLRERAREDRGRIARGDSGLVIDPRTGDPDLLSPEGQLRLARWRARSEMLREAVYCVRLLCPERPRRAEDLLVFLQDPHDGLVVETLHLLAQWRVEDALPAILELYRLYPGPRRWDTSHVLARAGSNGKAKSRWMVTVGHPDKQRHRPKVVEAIRACLQSIAGCSFDTPEALERHLRGDKKRRRLSAA
jgi:hypothetical protein